MLSMRHPGTRPALRAGHLFVLLLAWSVAAVAADSARHFSIVQLNDAYELFPVPVADGDHTEQRGGMAQVATLVNGSRARGPVLFLHAGDMLSPSLLSSRLGHRGAQMIAALNALELDAATFGNHEFDFGCRTVLERIRESRFPWIAANVEWPVAFAGDQVTATRIFERAGLRIGVFGVVVPLAPVGDCGGGSIVFRDPVTAARKAVDDLKGAGVDVIVGLTHQRMEEDRALAAAVPEIDLIIGGHEHSVVVAKVGKTLIVKSGANAANIGMVDVGVVRGGGEVRVSTESRMQPVRVGAIAPDPKVERLLAPYRGETESYAKVVGQIGVALDAREEVMRGEESNLGDFVADVVRARMGTDVALINGGGFRDDRVIPPGPLTLGDLYTLLPFRNQLVAVEVTGAQLLAALENGVSLAEQSAGRFPQISGMSFSYSRRRPPGRRIVEARVADKRVEPGRRYTLATTDFLLERGEIDGYTAILPKNDVRRGDDLQEAILAHLAGAGPVTVVRDGRIRCER